MCEDSKYDEANLKREYECKIQSTAEILALIVFFICFVVLLLFFLLYLRGGSNLKINAFPAF